MFRVREGESVIGDKPSERSLEEHLKYGVVCIDKPMGPSSHEVASFARKILGLKKAGHTGTLDQNVSGVLVVLLEEACKTAPFLMGSRKKYVCLMRLSKRVPKKELEEALSNFRGKIYQKPPEKSAVAKKLRIREVYSLNVLETEGNLVLFDAETDAGTYIRNIVFDVGEVLGVKAEMAELRRASASRFSEEKCVTLQKLSDYYWLWKERGEGQKLRESVTSLEDAVSELKRIVLSDEGIRRVSLGAKPRLSQVVEFDEKIEKLDSVGFFTGKGELCAVGIVFAGAKELIERTKTGTDSEIAKVFRVIHPF